MSATFIITPQPLVARNHRLVQKCRRRPSPSSPARCSPSMLAKYQPKESSEQPEVQSDLDKILPPPLPTLSTLTGSVDVPKPITEDSIPEDLGLEIVTEEKAPDEQLSLMGAALTSSQEGSFINFLKGVAQELNSIEWPSTERVLRLTVIIFLTIIVAGGALYVVDGFLYRISRVLFDGKI